MKIKKALVIGGPSGVGESTITNRIIFDHPKFIRLVTATTRQPKTRERIKEKQGVDYYFFSEAKFKEEIKKGNILEWQNTRNGVYYGAYKPDLETKLKKGYCVIINPDVVGARYFKKNYGATTIFIMPDSVESLKKRQLKRDPDITEDLLKKRLLYAKHEIDNESGRYDYIVINKHGQLGDAIKEVKNIIKKEGYFK